MTQLRFLQGWLNATSPVSLRYPFLGVSLRFDTAWPNAHSPIKLRFEGEIPPEPPFQYGDIGIAVDVVYGGSLSITDEIAIAYDTAGITNELVLTWYRVSLESNQGITWHDYGVVDCDTTIKFGGLGFQMSDTAVVWHIGAPMTDETVVAWHVQPVTDTYWEAVWGVTDLEHGISVTVAYQYSDCCDNDYTFAWDTKADAVEHDIRIAWGPHQPAWICSTKYRPPEVGLITIRFDQDDLWMSRNSPVALRFTPSEEYCYQDDGGGVIEGPQPLPDIDFRVPIEPQIKRTYIVNPTLTCHRVSDNVAIVLDGVTISDKRGQYSASISLDFSSKGDMDRAMNELLLIDINGYQFYTIPEEPSERRSFNSVQYSASGRGRVAYLSEPWKLPVSYTNNTDRSFGGILSDILQNSGWAAELTGFNDFNVPAGSFSVIGRSPIDSVAYAVEQVGCMIVADEENSKLKILPQYPTTPWAMDAAVADVNIHENVIISFNRQGKKNQLCDGIWVRGEQHGVSRHVRRTGTAGSVTTQDYTSSLIVDDIPARLVGTAKLADTGDKEIISVSLPVMADLPPLTKGMLIGVNYRGEVFKATCDNTSLSANVGRDGAIDVTQRVGLIRHKE